MFANLIAKSELMRASLLFALLAIFISSCSRYQYVTINGSDLKRNDKQEFVEENDSVRIQYNFNGPDAPINLSIENKTDAPIHIDWSRSALIVNDKAISYMSNIVPIEGAFSGSSVGVNHGEYSASSGSIYAKATLPDNLGFIPPRSYINKNPMSVTNQFVVAPDSVYHNEKITLYGGSLTKVSHASFTEQSSPLRFKSYLTLIFGDQNNRPVAYQGSFYISEIYNSGTDPETFLSGHGERGDQFYVRESTGFGRGFGVVAGVALLSTAAALGSKSVNNSSQ
jgi:hypothetical protein